ncbi:ABC transporter permease [Virgibacillus sp. W0430]|uniref:ABC transporter permease n=1 Tax=Virgibacillus sp. W0430 TaxID=3391580 RepID=UPI003F48564E
MVSKLTVLNECLIGVSILAFFLVRNSPIDPIQSYVGAEMMKIGLEQRENIAAYWGLHASSAEQFFHWLTAVIKGDLGTSLLYRTPVANVIKERFIASLALMLIAWVCSGIIGFIFGIVAGMNEGKLIDKVIKGYCFILASTPAFWLAIVLLMVFSVSFGWFPVGLAAPAGEMAKDVTFFERLHHLFLPALTLSIVGVANVALHTRQKLIEVLDRAFVRFARAKGEQGFSLLWKHGIRHISLPAISLQFVTFGELFGGTIVAEQVFSYPGLGQATIQAGLGGDIPLLLGIVLFSTVFVYVGNVLADLLYQVIDPRMRKGEIR